MTRANKQNNQEEEKMKQAQKNKIIKIWRKQYKEKQKKQKEQDIEIENIDKVEDYSDYSNELLKCFQLLNTGYSLEAGTLSKDLTASDHHRYICFIKNNMERLKKVTHQRLKKEKEKEERERPELIPVVTID